MTTTTVVPPLFLHAGFVRSGVQVAAPRIARGVRLRARTGFTAESEFVDVPGPAVRTGEQKRHRLLSHLQGIQSCAIDRRCGGRLKNTTAVARVFWRSCKGESRQILSRVIRTPQGAG